MAEEGAMDCDGVLRRLLGSTFGAILRKALQ